MSAAPPALPRFLTRCANDEFIPPPLNDVERRAARIAAEAGDSAVDRLKVRAEAYLE
jgi:hypothetical protein